MMRVCFLMLTSTLAMDPTTCASSGRCDVNGLDDPSNFLQVQFAIANEMDSGEKLTTLGEQEDDEDNDDDEKKKRRGSRPILKPSGHHQEAANKVALPQSAPETGCCQGLCMIYGDPHVISFDGAGSTFNRNHRFEFLWVVYSQSVKIQAWSPGSKNWLHGLAVTGDVIGNNHLAAYRDFTTHEFKVTWNGKEVNQKDGTFARPYPGVTLSRTTGLGADMGVSLQAIGDLFQKAEHKDRWISASKTLETWQREMNFVFELPGKIEILMAAMSAAHHQSAGEGCQAVLKMPPQPGEGSAAFFLEGVEGGQENLQGGICGNFNGNPSDDAHAQHLEPVAESDNLFKSSGISLSATFSQVDDGEEAEAWQIEVVEKCSSKTREKAEQACGHHPSVKDKESCVFDICASDDAGRAVEALDAFNMLIHFHGKGIPIFEGSGICLDSAGDSYSQIEATAVKSIQACARLLRKLAHFTDVRGAQITSKSACNILVNPGFKDLRNHQIPGGWGPFKAGKGQGAVGSSTLEKQTYCWKVL